MNSMWHVLFVGISVLVLLGLLIWLDSYLHPPYDKDGRRINYYYGP